MPSETKTGSVCGPCSTRPSSCPPGNGRRSSTAPAKATGCGRLEEAETLHRRALEMRRAALGDEHEYVAQSLHNLGTVLADRGRLDEAEDVSSKPLDLASISTGLRKSNPGRPRGRAAG